MPPGGPFLDFLTFIFTIDEEKKGGGGYYLDFLLLGNLDLTKMILSSY